MTVFDVLFNYLEIDLYAKSTQLILISVGVGLGVSLIMRILACAVYYTNISAFILFAKQIEKKSDIKKTPSALINRCVAEYMACGENGSPIFAVDQIVMKNILRMNILGMNLKSIEKLCAALEAVALGITAVAAVSTGQIGWLVLIGGVYLAYKIALLFFDADTLREKLYYGMSTYVNREIGKFYIPDDKAGMRVFKNELHSSLMEQASILQNAINNLNTELSGVMSKSYEGLRKSLDGELGKYDAIGEKLKRPVEGMGELFGKLEASAGLMKESAKALSVNIELMNKNLSAITESIDRNNAATAKTIDNSDVVFKELRNGLKSFDAVYSSVQSELASVRKNQRALDESLQKYELSLQETVGKVGDAIGSIVEYRGREATDVLNSAILKHMAQFQSDTSKLLDKMTALFEQSYEQNRSEIQTLLRLESLITKQETGEKNV